MDGWVGGRGEPEYRMKGSGWNKGSETCSLGVTGEDSGGK